MRPYGPSYTVMATLPYIRRIRLDSVSSLFYKSSGRKEWIVKPTVKKRIVNERKGNTNSSCYGAVNMACSRNRLDWKTMPAIVFERAQRSIARSVFAVRRRGRMLEENTRKQFGNATWISRGVVSWPREGWKKSGPVFPSWGRFFERKARTKFVTCSWQVYAILVKSSWLLKHIIFLFKKHKLTS